MHYARPPLPTLKLRGSCRARSADGPNVRWLACEVLEDRRLLTVDATGLLTASDASSPVALQSTATIPTAHTNVDVLSPGGVAPAGGSMTPFGFTPSQISQAYGINLITFNNGSVVGNGQGQAIAVVDAFDDPALKNSSDPNFATSDLAEFDASPSIGIANPPSFTKLNQTGGTSLPGTDPAGPGTNNWEVEEALDVEWAHALAPAATIYLIEANSTSLNDLIAAANLGAGLPNVVAVSMSWGAADFSGENTFDYLLTTPASHPGVTYLGATGDSGEPGNYPASSPNVVAVGGTRLLIDGSNNWASETGWTKSGGLSTSNENEPLYQDNVQSTGDRTIPDVSMDSAIDANAGPGTSPGLAVYDSYNNGTQDPWVRVGGTSASTPCWAALIAIADQGRALAGLPSLDSASRTLPTIYALPTTGSILDLRDITSGNSSGPGGSLPSGVGYDFVTGLGSPKVDLVGQDLPLIQGLVGLSNVSGEVFNDANGNGSLDNGESGLAGWTVYEDLNNNGVLDPITNNTFTSSNVPKSIHSTPVTSTNVVSGLTANIDKVTVTINVSFPIDGDLTINLVSPNNTTVTLYQVFGTGLTSGTTLSVSNFSNTTFDDAAADPIGSNGLSYNGTFQPSTPLAALFGSSPNGTWKLQITNSSGFSGTLSSWSMKITTGDPSTTSSATGAYQISNPIPGTYPVREVLQAPYSETAPASGVYSATVVSSLTLAGENFGNALAATTAPTSVSLLSASDTGISDSDGITKLNNSSVPSELQFSVTGTIAGASVSVFSDGNLIGTATAAGTTTTVTTNGAAMIADGTHTITAQQTQSGHATSANSSPLSIQVDTTAPTQTITSVTPNPRSNPVSQMTIVFSEPVFGFDLTDLALSLNGGGNLLTGSQTLSTGDHITWTLGNLNSITGASGNYVLDQTLAGTTITDTAGNADQTTSSTSFTVNPVAAPTSVSLLAASDTGISNSDGITNLNNSSPSAVLQFSVAGTITGALVSLYSDGNLIGTATASGAATVVTTDGVTTLAEGTHSITATQTPSGQSTSPSSSPLSIRIDTAPPTQTITAVSPNPRTSPVSQMTIVFSEAVYGLDLTDLTLTRNGGPNLLTGAQTVATGDHVTWILGNLSPLTGTAGNYVLNLTLAGTTITDTAGNADQTTSSSGFTVNASVISQALFYDNSKFNKNVEGVAAGTTDDKAIDPSKSAYLAGSGTATFANTSAFFDGINGVMVDIAGEAGALSAGDFTFRVGLNNSPSQWATAPAPSTVSVRAGAGTGGSDRVEITWTDGSITQEWLEVTVNADANTGLSAPYTFFYGSVIANSGTGDTGALAITSSTDENGARSHAGIATVSNIYDYNKDGFVNSSDENAARGNGATIKFIKIAANTPLAPDASPTVTPAVTVSPATTASPAITSAPAAAPPAAPAITGSPTPNLSALATLNQACSASVPTSAAHPTVVGNQSWSTSGALTSKSIQATADEFWHVVDDSLLELLAIARRQATLRKA